MLDADRIRGEQRFAVRRRACRITGSVHGATVQRWPCRFSWLREDDFCAFSVDAVPFLIFEPFGDNDCYWIVAADPDPAARPLIERVRQSFAAALGVKKVLCGCPVFSTRLWRGQRITDAS